MKKTPDFDKYDYYLRGVQTPDVEAELLRRFYQKHRGSDPILLREDFCGTFKLCCEWVSLDKKKKAIGVDLDSEPVNYGVANYWAKLTESQRERVLPLCQNVMDPRLPSADLICALNGSYFALKKRTQLKTYFTAVHKALNKKGLFVVDVFGGKEFHGTCRHSHRRMGFTYYWDQPYFNPINNEMRLNLNFVVRNSNRERKKVFTYDWRLWSLPEIRELLEEVGFAKTYVYWERGLSGKFYQTEVGDECLTWIAYVVALR